MDYGICIRYHNSILLNNDYLFVNHNIIMTTTKTMELRVFRHTRLGWQCGDGCYAVNASVTLSFHTEGWEN